MDKPVRFTTHAKQKFSDLADMGFTVTEEQVVDTVINPEEVDESDYPLTAQKVVSERHVLWVVFKEDSEGILIITFYPGRRKRYGD